MSKSHAHPIVVYCHGRTARDRRAFDRLIDRFMPGFRAIAAGLLADESVPEVIKEARRHTWKASQVRAIERMKDRTGLHILAGCAADRVSYEASQ